MKWSQIAWVFSAWILALVLPHDAFAQQSRYLGSKAQSSVSAVKAKQWLKPESKGKMVEHRKGVYVQIQKAKDQKDNHCVMNVPPDRVTASGKKVYRVKKAINVCE